jgi:hypothetical protein
MTFTGLSPIWASGTSGSDITASGRGSGRTIALPARIGLRRLLISLTTLVFGMVLCASAPPARADAALDKVLECMRANVPPTLRIEDVQLTSYDRIGTERKMSGKLYAIREDGYLRAMLRLLTPSDLSGAAYLIQERTDRDDMFLYLPSVNRVRRINSSTSDGSLMGTSFSYTDIKQIQNVLSGGDIVRGADDKLGEIPVYRLTMKMPSGKDSEYTRADVWVDQKTCVTLRAELLAGANIRKRLEAPPDSIKKVGGYSYVSAVTVTDLQSGTSTRMEVTGVSSGDPLASRYFDPHTFYLGN